MLTYILEVTLCWFVLYSIFFVALRKLTFFRMNRWYLMLSLVSGIFIPLLKKLQINFYQEDVAELAPLVYVIKDAPSQMALAVSEQTTDWSYILSTLVLFIYIIGALFFVARLYKGLMAIRLLYVTAIKIEKASYILVSTTKDHLPFSFFKWVFVSSKLKLGDEFEQIIKHEVSHVKGRHSIDILIIELIQIVFWFNPFIYLYKTALRQTHEYLADHAVLQHGSRKAYGTLLLKQSLSGLQIALTNQFFHSHIKKRINMMYQEKSGQSAWLKYALTLPVLLLLFIVFSGYQPNINDRSPALPEHTILEQLETAYKNARQYPNEVNISDVLLTYNALRVQYSDQLGDLKNLFMKFLSEKQIDYRLNDQGMIEGLKLRNNLQNVQQSNIPIILYEGNQLKFASREEEKEYKNSFTGLEIISGDKCYEKFGNIAKGRNTVFNYVKSDGFLLRTNEEESYVYHNGKEWIHRYSSPLSGKIRIIISDENHKEVWEKEFTKTGKSIETPIAKYRVPQGPFKISIDADFSGRMDSGFIIVDQKVKLSKVDYPSSKPNLLREESVEKNQNKMKTDTLPDRSAKYPEVQNHKAPNLDIDHSKNSLIIYDGKHIGRGYDLLEEIDIDNISRFEFIKDEKSLIQYGPEAEDGVIIITSKEKEINPLIIIDGTHRVRHTDIPYDLKPDDIEQIDVIKGEKATEEYGNEGKNGVILITTKDGIFSNENIRSNPRTHQLLDDQGVQASVYIPLSHDSMEYKQTVSLTVLIDPDESSVDLYEVYSDYSPISVEPSDIYYFVTNYNSEAIENIEINTDGIMTFDVIKRGLENHSVKVVYLLKNNIIDGNK